MMGLVNDLGKTRKIDGEETNICWTSFCAKQHARYCLFKKAFMFKILNSKFKNM